VACGPIRWQLATVLLLVAPGLLSITLSGGSVLGLVPSGFVVAIAIRTLASGLRFSGPTLTILNPIGTTSFSVTEIESLWLPAPDPTSLVPFSCVVRVRLGDGRDRKVHGLSVRNRRLPLGSDDPWSQGHLAEVAAMATERGIPCITDPLVSPTG